MENQEKNVRQKNCPCGPGLKPRFLNLVEYTAGKGLVVSESTGDILGASEIPLSQIY